MLVKAEERVPMVATSHPEVKVIDKPVQLTVSLGNVAASDPAEKRRFVVRNMHEVARQLTSRPQAAPRSFRPVVSNWVPNLIPKWMRRPRHSFD